MADENLLDLQQIQCVIPPGSNGTRITVTHNLYDDQENDLTPDTVVVEVVDYPDEDPLNPCNLVGHTRISSTPEDGTYDLEIRASEANTGVNPWQITLQITSMYEHSIQSDDHAPELTVQPGNPLWDCEASDGPPVFVGGTLAHLDPLAGWSWSDIFVQPLPAPYDTPGDELDFESTGVHAYAYDDVWTCGWWNWASGFVARWYNGSWTIWDVNDGLVDGLEKIFVIAPDDVWATSYWGPNCIIVHWDGVSWTDYTSVFTPGPKEAVTYSGVFALAPDDVWFCGARYDKLGPNPVVSHWNGSTFDIINQDIPINQGVGAEMLDIFAADENNIWAVGKESGSPFPTLPYGYIWHYNGSTWSDVTPAFIGNCNGLQGVHGLDANNVWAVGGGVTKSGGGYRIAYWNGSTWTQITDDPVFQKDNEVLWGVFAYSRSNVWISQNDASYRMYHWNGTAWSEVVTGVSHPWNYGFYVVSGIWY